MKKPHILIVEDEAILYENLRKKLVKENYTVADYTPSVDEAIKNINKQRPNIVLLDINLQGKYSGLDLGKLLNETYNIPFVYITERSDDDTFHQGLYETNHEDYLVKVRGKLDIENLRRRIKTILHKHKEPIVLPKDKTPKEAASMYVDYIKKAKQIEGSAKGTISEVTVPYKEVFYFTTNTRKVISENKITGKKKYEKMDANNARVETFSKKSYVAPNNLSKIEAVLPVYFFRISNDYIINMDYVHFNGRINGNRIVVNNEVFFISDDYKPAFNKKFKELYQSFKKGDFQ